MFAIEKYKDLLLFVIRNCTDVFNPEIKWKFVNFCENCKTGSGFLFLTIVSSFEEV